MSTNKDLRRRNPRLPGYDYSQPGFYFVTVCTKDRSCTLGSIEDVAVSLSAVGAIVEQCLWDLPTWFPDVRTDQYVVMPNHVHLIVEILEKQTSLSTIIGSFKSAASRLSRESCLIQKKDLWQRGYFDRIIRNEDGLLRARQYVLDNPVQWHLDELNPDYRVPALSLQERATHGVAPTGINRT